MTDNPRPYSVRLPEQLRSQLENIAKKNNRSLHAEILLRLENTLTTTANQEEYLTEKEVRKIAHEMFTELSKNNFQN